MRHALLSVSGSSSSLSTQLCHVSLVRREVDVLKIDVLQVANAMDTIEEAVRAVHERLSIDELLDMSTTAAAGRTGASVLA